MEWQKNSIKSRFRLCFIFSYDTKRTIENKEKRNKTKKEKKKDR